MINNNIIETSCKYYKSSLPHISVDCVIFGYDNGQLYTILVETSEAEGWFLPGGYIGKNEDLEASAIRILKERSGAEKIFLQQFGAFGKLNRSEAFFDEYPDDLWHKQRFLTIAYYGLVEMSNVTLSKDSFSSDIRWFPIRNLPDMVMDHQDIFELAFKILKEQINFRPIGLNLLPEEFTIPELQKLYEAILEHKLNRGNFYKKILKFGILKDLNKVKEGVKNRAPKLYSFDLEKYHENLNDLIW